MKNNNLNLIIKVVACVLLILVSVLWLLSALMPDTFGGHSLSWLITIVAAGLGVLSIVKGVLEKELISIRKFYVFLGVVLIAAGVCALIGAFIPTAVALPIIAIVVCVAALISTVFVNNPDGRKWDAGDNQNPDYKNYYRRKAEAEAKEKEQTPDKPQGDGENKE